MRDINLRSMSVDELWSLSEQVAWVLAKKIRAEKAKLEDRLRRIGSASNSVTTPAPERRPYPKVLPKFRNPENRSETWAGRGKQPRWLVAQLRSGKKLEEFQIKRA